MRNERVALAAANSNDVGAAQQAGLAAPLVDRLRLTDKIIDTVAEGCEQIAAMPDPVGEISGVKRRPSGISVGQMRVPLGVFGMVYESRPNVTIEAASLAIKSGNACILRGGSEAIHSNLALWRLVQLALVAAGLPRDAVQLVQTTDRAAVGRLIAMPEYVDVIIPRGGKGLDRAHQPRSEGAGHQASRRQLLRLCRRARRPRARACSDRQREDAEIQPVQRGRIAARASRGGAAFSAALGAIFAAKGVEMRCDAASKALLASVGARSVTDATEADWSTEYLAPIISVAIVDSLDEAIAHINRYGSHHTDAILTADHANAMRFLREVDSASVIVNASTRFADGFEYGLGAEIGISTDKLHARGPVGLEGLTSLKWVVFGQGELRG